MRALGCALALALVASAGTAFAQSRQRAPAISFSGGTGETCDRAVVIKGARNTAAGIAAERGWISRNHRGARFTGSAITRSRSKIFDVVSIAKADGTKVDVCFDVTGFFGTW